MNETTPPTAPTFIQWYLDSCFVQWRECTEADLGWIRRHCIYHFRFLN